MDLAFIAACDSNDLDRVKKLRIPNDIRLINIFIDACGDGYLDIAKYVYNLHPLRTSLVHGFINACKHGHIHVAQWIHSVGIDIADPDSYKKAFNDAFKEACVNGHLHVAQWLHSLGADISDPNAFIFACYNYHIDVVKWLIDIHYKYSGFIDFPDYSKIELKIKKILIDTNLVHPRQLNPSDLEYYLARTNRIVPSDFDYPNTHKRGHSTKPAL